MQLARTYARAAHAKDVVYRRWNAFHGGVYVPVTEENKPNPYLVVPERDVRTPSGRLLTLVNPASMTRQVHELISRKGETTARITSRKPLNPVNAPDAWEEQALQALEDGQTEVSTLTIIDGAPYMRLIRPLYVEEVCLKCHGAQGYRLGDVRGGISVSVSVGSIWASQASQSVTVLAEYGTLWFVGIIGIAFAGRGLRRRTAELERTAKELRRSEKRFRSYFDQGWVGMAIATRTGRLTQVNDRLCEILGYSRDELVRMTESELGDPEDAELGRDQLASMLAGEIDGYTVEKRLIRKDGNSVPTCVVARGFRHDDDTVDHLLLLVQDISDRKRIETELAQAQRLESIGQLAAGIAHELNTPSQYIGDNTRFLQEAFADIDKLLRASGKLLEATKESLDAEELIAEMEALAERADVDYLLNEIPKAIRQSLEGVDRVAGIVHAMKEFSHPGGVQKQAVNLNRAIQNTLTISRSEWKHVADMICDLDASLPLVPLHPSAFNQVILNIVINAAHTISEVIGDGSQGKGTITISTRREGTWVELRIQDTGGGIPEAIQSKVFDPFFTTKEVGKGTGQGLHIAHSIVTEKHGGTIHFETECAKGTTFIVRLPIADDPVPEAKLSRSGCA